MLYKDMGNKNNFKKMYKESKYSTWFILTKPVLCGLWSVRTRRGIRWDSGACIPCTTSASWISYSDTALNNIWECIKQNGNMKAFQLWMSFSIFMCRFEGKFECMHVVHYANQPKPTWKVQQSNQSQLNFFL